MAEKRKYPEGECQHCGGPMKVATSNQKWCATCRLGRQAAAHTGWEAECPLCGEAYIDWSQTSRRNAGAMRCGGCFIRLAPMGARESVPGTCVWHPLGKCHSDTETWVYSTDVRLCFPCLTDPDKFKSNRRAIAEKHVKLTS